MGDFADRQILLALEGPQECTCCSIDMGSPDDNCDVLDGQPICIDCLATYYPAIYARRSGEDLEELEGGTHS